MTLAAGTEDRLTPRELEVLRLYAQMGSVKAVAHELGLSRQTVKNHLTNARSRLDVGSTVQAVYVVFGEPA